MNSLTTKRYLVLSGALLFPSMNPVILLMRLAMAARLKDARSMEQLLGASDIDWTIVRPPHLKDSGPAVGYRVKAGALPRSAWDALHLTDLANFLLDAIERREFIRQVVGIGPA